MVIAGDAAGMVNVPELKGIHYAMHAGMYAAEAIVDALKKDSINFEAYDERKVEKSVIEEDIYRSRNMRQPFSKGFFVGGAMASAMTITRGALPRRALEDEHDAEDPMAIGKRRQELPEARRQVHLRQALVGLRSRATRRATTRRTTSASRTRCRARSRRPGSRCARRRSTRSPTSSWRAAPREVDVQHHRLELRAVRRDHRQGRAPDAARGRRRAPLPGDLAS